MDIPNPLPTSTEAGDEQQITGGALNITKGTFLAAVVSELLISVNGVFEKIFGENSPTWVKPAVMITLLAIWGVIATADVLARGYAHGQARAASSAGEIVPLPPALVGETRVKILQGDNPTGRLLAVRASGSADSRSTELLIAIDEGGMEWAPADTVKKI